MELGNPAANRFGGSHEWVDRDELITVEGEYETGCRDHGAIHMSGLRLLDAVEQYRQTGRVERMLIWINPPRYRIWLGKSDPGR
jgi:hypothetical protein